MTGSITSHGRGWTRPTVEQERNLAVYQTMAFRFMVLTPICKKSSIMTSQSPSNFSESTMYCIAVIEMEE